MEKTFCSSYPGKEAARKFKSLRDIVCKEKRKIINTQPRPEAGATGCTQYKPTWDYYSDLIFLVDHIEPKKTYSNMALSELCTVQSECDEDTMSNLTQNLSTINKNDEMTSSVSQITPINIDMVKEALQSIDTYNMINNSDINKDLIVEASEKNSNENMLINTRDTGHDTLLSCIRQKVTLKRENIIPPNETQCVKRGRMSQRIY